MRVLNIMLAKGSGGIETMAVRYHEALSALGHDVVSLGHPKGALAQGIEPAQFKPITTLFNNDLFAALKLRQLAKRFKADIVITHGNRATGLSLMAATGLRAKTIAVVHNFRFKGHLEQAKAVFCVSKAVRRAVRQAHPQLKAFLLPNFSHLRFHPIKAGMAETPRIGVLGRLHSNKGFDIALDACAHLDHEGVPFQLSIAGDGPEKEALRAKCRKLGLTERTTFAGWVDDTNGYLSGLDLFLLPSRTEPFGLVVTEAMAAGVPVIVSDIDGPREIIDHNRSGLLVAAQDASALAQAIKSSLGNWDATLQRAQAAQAVADELYDFEAGKTRLNLLLTAVSKID